MTKFYFKQLFVAALLLFNITAFAANFEIDGIIYTITDETNLTVEAGTTDRYIEVADIPATVTYEDVTYKVTAISKSGFNNRQYLTIGINGLVEAAEFMGLKITPNDDYLHFVQGILGLIEEYNKKYRTKEVRFNCEMIPAENVGVKHAKWDKEDGYVVPRECYNSYFYIVEDESLNIIDKIRLHGRRYIDHLTGGSALHMNLEEHLTKEQYRHLLHVAALEGCNYLTFNIPNTICNECGHIDQRYMKKCPHCGSENLDYLTRVIGYMKRVSNFSQARQREASRRFYAKW